MSSFVSLEDVKKIYQMGEVHIEEMTLVLYFSFII